MKEITHVIEREEGLRLLEASVIGRFAGLVRGRPLVYPVNYIMANGGIIFCTRESGDLDGATDKSISAFEIDSIDTILHEGWSVLVVGRCSHVTDPEELKDIDLWRFESWAGADRRLVVRIEIDEVHGRRVSHEPQH